MKKTFLVGLMFIVNVRAFFNFFNSAVSDKDVVRKQMYTNKCWNTFGISKLLDFMDKIDKKYETARQDAQQYLDLLHFTERMLENIGHTKPRVRPEEQHYYAKIPSRTNLGGFCTMTLTRSVLFFHRMKLSNEAYFKIKELHSDVNNMVLKGKLSMKYLQLTGPYDISFFDTTSFHLKHANSVGELQILMRDIEYSIEGRYILSQDTLMIEVLLSALNTSSITMTHVKANQTNATIAVKKEYMGEFLRVLKSDLDNWAKTYFNNYLSEQIIDYLPSITSLRAYDFHKNMNLALFTRHLLKNMNRKLKNLGGNIRLPDIRITASHNMTIKLHAGNLHLGSLRMQSETTGNVKENNHISVDTIIGFDGLKITYAYKIVYPKDQQTSPSPTGVIQMTDKHQMAQISLDVFNENETLTLDGSFLSRMGPDSVVVMGSDDILKSKFKHILNNEIASIMSNSVTYGINFLKSLIQCEPFIDEIKPGMKIKIIKEYIETKSNDVPLELKRNLRTTPEMKLTTYN